MKIEINEYLLKLFHLVNHWMLQVLYLHILI